MTPGESSPHFFQVTQSDVAKALGLSRATVSFAMRNDPRIPLARRKEIQAAAQKMGYIPNPAATTLAHFKKTSSVEPVQAALAWLNCWPKPAQLRAFGEFDLYWQGASSTAEKFGYRLEEFTWAPNEPMQGLEKILLSRGINGILLPPHKNHPKWLGFNWKRFSIVRLGRSLQRPVANVVTSDHVANMMLAFQQLHRLGYQRIGYAEAPGNPWHLFEAGYLLAQQIAKPENRLPVYRLPEDLPTAQRQKHFARWVAQENPDALLGTIEMVKSTERKVPDDIALAAMTVLDSGCDTGINQNSWEIGRAAVLQLISQLHDNDRGEPEFHREILIKGSWVDGTCAPGIKPKTSVSRSCRPVGNTSS